MIQINLLEEHVDNTAAYVVEGIVYLAAVSMSCLICFFLSLSTQQSLELETQTKMTLTASLQKLQKETAHVANLEKQEKQLSERLTTIARLKALQKIPILLLDELTQVLPERAWITEFTQRGNNLFLNGIAFDNQTISVFMNQLEKSVFVKEVVLKFSEQFKKGQADLKKFELRIPLYPPLQIRNRYLKRLQLEEQREAEMERTRQRERGLSKLDSLAIDNRSEEEKASDLAADDFERESDEELDSEENEENASASKEVESVVIDDDEDGQDRKKSSTQGEDDLDSSSSDEQASAENLVSSTMRKLR